MAVTENYLAKIRFSVRRAPGDALVDEELLDEIEQARADMVQKGVPAATAADEDDKLVLGAIRCFVRWMFGLGGVDSEVNHNNYLEIVDQLRKSTTAQGDETHVLQ